MLLKVNCPCKSIACFIFQRSWTSIIICVTNFECKFIPNNFDTKKLDDIVRYLIITEREDFSKNYRRKKIFISDMFATDRHALAQNNVGLDCIYVYKAITS